ncbi:hypothetical protein ASG03_03445 [Rhizobium sp. Leaf341]|nr:hypothetical protein ASG03_03445 [Rhizobium sp. Leaf341]
MFHWLCNCNTVEARVICLGEQVCDGRVNTIIDEDQKLSRKDFSLLSDTLECILEMAGDNTTMCRLVLLLDKG